MAKKFVLVSLQEKKAKKIAEVISNNTCRRILDYMATRKDVTESEISKQLKIPISTVHYNMKALIEARLVKSDEYHYSEKGKEVSHYRLANQYVIIAPEEEKEALREKLKSLLPVALIAGFGASVLRLFAGFFGSQTSMKAAPMLASRALPEMAADADAIAGGSAPVLYEAAEEAVVETVRESADEAVRVSAQKVAADGVASAPSLAQNAVEPLAYAAPTAPSPAPMPADIPTDYISEPGLWGYLQLHSLDILLWFAVGAALGVGVWFLVRYVRKRRRKLVKVKVKAKRS